MRFRKHIPSAKAQAARWPDADRGPTWRKRRRLRFAHLLAARLAVGRPSIVLGRDGRQAACPSFARLRAAFLQAERFRAACPRAALPGVVILGTALLQASSLQSVSPWALRQAELPQPCRWSVRQPACWKQVEILRAWNQQGGRRQSEHLRSAYRQIGHCRTKRLSLERQQAASGPLCPHLCPPASAHLAKRHRGRDPHRSLTRARP